MKNIIYRFFELIFKDGITTNVSGVVIKLPFRYYRYYEKDYELDNITFFRKKIKTDNVVIDIGAQIGLMTKLFADLVGPTGKVYTFEPTPKTFNVLSETIRINKMENNVIPFQEALSDKKGKAIFNISNIDIDASNTLSNVIRNSTSSAIEINVTSVDEVVNENSLTKVDFIKIDAEGAEYYVLLGAKNTMVSLKPIINLALHPNALTGFNSSLKEIYAFIKSNNYKVIYKFNEMDEKDFIQNTNLFDVQLMPIV